MFTTQAKLLTEYRIAEHRNRIKSLNMKNVKFLDEVNVKLYDSVDGHNYFIFLGAHGIIYREKIPSGEHVNQDNFNQFLVKCVNEYSSDDDHIFMDNVVFHRKAASLPIIRFVGTPSVHFLPRNPRLIGACINPIEKVPEVIHGLSRQFIKNGFNHTVDNLMDKLYGWSMTGLYKACGYDW